eukprot:9499197-Pyramimonas_sp.AAC.1
MRRYIIQAMRSKNVDSKEWINLIYHTEKYVNAKVKDSDNWAEEAHRFALAVEAHRAFKKAVDIVQAGRTFLTATKPKLTYNLRKDRADHLARIAEEAQGFITDHRSGQA